MKQERKPAQIVKCPDCEWKGSARGLFSHARLLHNKRINDAREVAVNPYSVKAKQTTNRKKSIGSISNNPQVTPEEFLIGVGVALLLKWVSNQISEATFRAECNKLKATQANHIEWNRSKSPQRPTTTPPLN